MKKYTSEFLYGWLKGSLESWLYLHEDSLPSDARRTLHAIGAKVRVMEDENSYEH